MADPCDALPQKFDGAALLDTQIESGRLRRLQDRRLLLLVIQNALPLDLGRHQEQRQIAIGGHRWLLQPTEPPGDAEEPFIVRRKEDPLRRQQLPRHIEKDSLPLFRGSGYHDLERDLRPYENSGRASDRRR
jgi:hypothetical protein